MIYMQIKSRKKYVIVFINKWPEEFFFNLILVIFMQFIIRSYRRMTIGTLERKIQGEVCEQFST